MSYAAVNPLPVINPEQPLRFTGDKKRTFNEKIIVQEKHNKECVLISTSNTSIVNSPIAFKYL